MEKEFSLKFAFFEKEHTWFAYRSISDISLEPSKPCVNSFAWPAASSEYNYWDLKVTARSFLYRQVTIKTVC